MAQDRPVTHYCSDRNSGGRLRTGVALHSNSNADQDLAAPDPPLALLLDLEERADNICPTYVGIKPTYPIAELQAVAGFTSFRTTCQRVACSEEVNARVTLPLKSGPTTLVIVYYTSRFGHCSPHQDPVNRPRSKCRATSVYCTQHPPDHRGGRHLF